MKWVWERRRTLVFWGFIVYLLVLAVVLAAGTIVDVVDPPQPTIVP